MRRLLLALTSVAMLATALAVPATAITNDYVKDFDHPFVGLIAFYDGNGDFSHRCSGSLLNPTVFLTAGHCTDDGAGGVMASARIWFRQDAGTRFNGTMDPLTGYPNTCINDPGFTGEQACVTAHTMFNYGFNNFAGFPNTRDAGVVIPPTMGLATAINFQPTGDGRAAITGDFVMTAAEVNPVIRALREHGIEVTSLHNHLLADEPRLFFMHFWANADAATLARGLRAALDRTNSAKPAAR